MLNATGGKLFDVQVIFLGVGWSWRPDPLRMACRPLAFISTTQSRRSSLPPLHSSAPPHRRFRLITLSLILLWGSFFITNVRLHVYETMGWCGGIRGGLSSGAPGRIAVDSPKVVSLKAVSAVCERIVVKDIQQQPTGTKHHYCQPRCRIQAGTMAKETHRCLLMRQQVILS